MGRDAKDQGNPVLSVCSPFEYPTPFELHFSNAHLNWYPADPDDYIEKMRGTDNDLAAPFSVFLNKDDKNYVEPDISVICGQDKLDDKGCIGAPDWIIEITFPSNPERDYGIKLYKYRTAGVREYWIVNPQKRAVIVYDFEREERTNHYSFEDTISACIFEDLSICIADLLEA